MAPPNRLYFHGRFLMKYLAEELLKVYSMLSEDDALHESDEDAISIYERFMISPLVLREMKMSVNITMGYRDSNEFLVRHDLNEDDSDAIPCIVIEYRIPFDGHEPLFDFTTSPLPFYPYGRVEDGCFIISVKDGERSFLSDYDYQLALLRENVNRTFVCVGYYNEGLREIINTLS